MWPPSTARNMYGTCFRESGDERSREEQKAAMSARAKSRKRAMSARAKSRKRAMVDKSGDYLGRRT